MKHTRGGKRVGAGRKPIPDAQKRITRSVNMEGKAWDNLEAKAQADGMSISAIVNRWAKKLKP